jgi:16S rRNA (cytosine967-C5)-methyltransferase
VTKKRPAQRAPTARSVAAEVLARVRKEGAFAAAALDAELGRSVQLEDRDRALATELVYGTLRYQKWLERRIARHASRGIDGLDPPILAILTIAAYQILVLTRIPAFAAVNEAVSAARSLRGDRVSGFVNAVLRKVANDPRPTEEELAAAALASADPALAKALERSLGKDGARAIFGGAEPPPLGLRVEDASSRDAWLAKLREARPDATFEPGRASPLAILAHGAGRLVDLPGYAEGAWTSQEEGSQIVALALGAKPGEVVLDACAGRGNKTGVLARAVEKNERGKGPGEVDAADLHPNKLERLAIELARIGLRARRTFAVDWSAGVGDATGPYDRALVDAPCSGTGTIRRRPEILLRRRADELPALAALQRTILGRVASLVRPGGRVVYAVCSVLREEAEEVVAKPEELGLRPIAFDASALVALAGDRAETLRLSPAEHGTDGYFIASFERTSERSERVST